MFNKQKTEKYCMIQHTNFFLKKSFNIYIYTHTMHHKFNNKYIKTMETQTKFLKHKKKTICLFLISMIMNLYVKRTKNIKRNK